MNRRYILALLAACGLFLGCTEGYSPPAQNMGITPTSGSDLKLPSLTPSLPAPPPAIQPQFTMPAQAVPAAPAASFGR